ncbi:phosphoribosylanthranilate isomerase [Mariniphaga anaerophila]|uniref:N-(5'-phosphoribosyl)anthranilate isomerase n=1 Tax=Mariniphaga anaerophila TaxID=1484053 RepID=A0A1M5CSU9_9BACT|nr:phosphoribosylanthranilate isomerase [Mariniphaga anaerophila]SHF57801.1 phosphoribosylanthranilate isomerase [Mariniphaga anaerophila]
MTKALKIKVCGMKNTANREAVEKLPVDFLGFIFYPKSQRFVGEVTEPRLFDSSKKKVAVFVDENAFEILGLAKNLGFNYVQLHGKENPKTCSLLRKQGLKVIKAFNLDERFNFSALNSYEKSVDYFLFDTKTGVPGGSGEKFNWEILKNYSGETPFFLSGGIKPEDAETIVSIDLPQLFGVDLNSGFEDAPGLKNIENLKNFISQLQRRIDIR